MESTKKVGMVVHILLVSGSNGATFRQTSGTLGIGFESLPKWRELRIIPRYLKYKACDKMLNIDICFVVSSLEKR